jgi:N-acetylmuramoyl-L-alanine amidase CwlA
MNIKTNLANKQNYGGSRATSKIKWIVIHYTANDGDTDEGNGNYFHNNVVKSSAHYFVDDDSITQTVPDNYSAYHCGAKKYKHASCRNSNSIGIEICDDIKNGVIYPSDKTIKNVLELVEYLMKKYSIPKSNVIRHYDVTGKLCPAYWVDDCKWKSEFWNKIGVKTEVKEAPKTTTALKIDPAKAFNKSVAKTYYTTANLNLRCGAGTSKAIVTVIPKGKAARCYGYYTPVNGTKWLLVAYDKYTGFVSSKYLR